MTLSPSSLVVVIVLVVAAAVLVAVGYCISHRRKMYVMWRLSIVETPNRTLPAPASLSFTPHRHYRRHDHRAWRIAVQCATGAT